MKGVFVTIFALSVPVLISTSPISSGDGSVNRSAIGEWLDEAKSPVKRDIAGKHSALCMGSDYCNNDASSIIRMLTNARWVDVGDICGQPKGKKVRADTANADTWKQYYMADYMIDM